MIIADKKDAEILDTESQNESCYIFWKILNYNKLHRKYGEIKGLVEKHEIDFVLYSRNDQVANRVSIGPVTRKLGTGYSSFSGIDENDRVQQMKTCFEDFMNCDKRLDFDIIGKERNLPEINYRGETFSLIFDTEQLGGVKYGLPRILELLKKYNVKATFFVTNLMKKVYPNVLEEIRGQDHEVGLHGMWHEFLSDLEKEEQRLLIQDMIYDFGGEVYGANFIGRMNKDAIQVLVQNRIKYFVHAFINRYHFTSYSKFSTIPRLIHFQNKKIWMLPVPVETYGSPWFSIKNMIDSTLLKHKRSFLHISILCHPFRDGNLAHIRTMEKMLYYLLKKGLKPTTLKEVVNNLLDNGFFTNVDINEVQTLFKPKNFFSIPKTKQDLLGLIPENVMTIYKIIQRGHTVF